MQLTPAMTFRGVRHWPALEAEILARVRKLETHYRRITRCRVLVGLAQRRHEAGNRYHVRIDLTVPGEEIVVAHDASLHDTAQDVHAERVTRQAELGPERKHVRVAIHEAFDIAKRRLHDHARRHRSIKTTRQTRGHVS